MQLTLRMRNSDLNRLFHHNKIFALHRSFHSLHQRIANLSFRDVNTYSDFPGLFNEVLVRVS